MMYKDYNSEWFNQLYSVCPENLFQNKKGEVFFDVVNRKLDGTFGEFTRVLPGFDSIGNEACEDALSKIKSELLANNNKLSEVLKNTSNTSKYIKQLSASSANIELACKGIKALNWVNIACSVANMSISIAGFAVMSNKINQVSKKIDGLASKLEEVYKDVKEALDLSKTLNIDERYKRILSDTNTVVVNVKRGHEVSYDELLHLLKEYCSFLDSMINTAVKYPSEELLCIIYALSPLFADMIVLYYELFYDRDKENLNPSHKEWIDVFESLSSEVFINMLTDYYTITKQYHHAKVNEIKIANVLISCNAEIKINDTLSLLVALGSSKDYKTTKTEVEKAIKCEIDNHYEMIKGELNITEEKWEEVKLEVLGAGA